MFSLTPEEIMNLSQFVTSSTIKHAPNVFAFTEHGIAILSSIIRSRRAIAVNIEIMRAFVRLREMVASQKEIAKQLEELEKKYDARFKVVFDTIHALLEPPKKQKNG